MKTTKMLFVLASAMLLASCGGTPAPSSTPAPKSSSSQKSAESISAESKSEESTSETSTSETPGPTYAWYVVGSMTEWHANPAWGLVKNDGSTDEEYTGTFTFTEGDIWKICNADETVWNQNFKTGDGSAIDAGQMELVDDGYGGKNCQVKVTGEYTMYYKVDGSDPGVWITALAE